MEQKLAIYRYSDEELENILDAFSEFEYSLGQDVDYCNDIYDFMLSQDLASPRGGRDIVLPPMQRKGYQAAYEEYKRSKLSFKVLMLHNKFIEEINQRYFKWREIVIHVFEIPLEEVPLYLNSGDSWVRFFSRIRLEYGK
jgi:hypothetical protein